jgi:hypothetical protein
MILELHEATLNSDCPINATSAYQLQLSHPLPVALLGEDLREELDHVTGML